MWEIGERAGEAGAVEYSITGLEPTLQAPFGAVYEWAISHLHEIGLSELEGSFAALRSTDWAVLACGSHGLQRKMGESGAQAARPLTVDEVATKGDPTETAFTPNAFAR